LGFDFFFLGNANLRTLVFILLVWGLNLKEKILNQKKKAFNTLIVQL